MLLNLDFAPHVYSGSEAFCSSNTVWLWKKWFRRFDFSFPVVYINPLLSRCGIWDLVFWLIIDFSVDQQSLEQRDSDYNILLIAEKASDRHSHYHNSFTSSFDQNFLKLAAKVDR